MSIFSACFAAGCAPLINDIVTDGDNPILIFRDDKALEYDARMLAQQLAAYPSLAPLRVDTSSVEAHKLVREILADKQLESRQKANATSGIVFTEQFVAVTPILRFRDDVAIQVRPLNKDQSEIHMRSRSRLGKGDLGANAHRIESFLEKLAILCQSRGIRVERLSMLEK